MYMYVYIYIYTYTHMHTYTCIMKFCAITSDEVGSRACRSAVTEAGGNRKMLDLLTFMVGTSTVRKHLYVAA